MDTIQSTLNDISETIKQYILLLEKTGFSGANPDISEFIQESLSAISSIQIRDDKKLESVFKNYYEITSSFYNLELIGKIFRQSQITNSQIGTTTSSMIVSSKYVSDLSGLLGTLLGQLDLIKMICLNLKINKILADRIEITYENVNTIVDSASTIYRGYVESGDGIHVIDLYFEILDRLYAVSVDKPGSREVVQYISDTIDAIKRDILKTSLYNAIESSLEQSNRTVNPIQNMLQTFKLIPDLPGPIETKLKLIDVAYKNDIVKTLTNASKLLKTGFILINKIGPNPILITIDRVIKPLKPIDPLAGVNPTIIENTNTIQALKATKAPIDGIKIIGDFEFYYILSTLDGTNWSFLAPWSDIIKPVPRENILVSLSETKTIDIGPSAKPGMYNTIINEKILKSLHKPFVINQVDMPAELKREDAYWNAIRQKIKHDILVRYKEYLQGYKSVRVATIRHMLTEPAEIERQMKHIGKLAIEEFGLDNIKLKNQPESIIQQFKVELATIYLHEIRSIERRFLTSLNDLLDENTTKLERATTSKEKEISLANINRIISILEPIIEEHLKIFINRKSSIFITLQNMIDILEKTLFI
jgi:hypothetical protein